MRDEVWRFVRLGLRGRVGEQGNGNEEMGTGGRYLRPRGRPPLVGTRRVVSGCDLEGEPGFSPPTNHPRECGTAKRRRSQPMQRRSRPRRRHPTPKTNHCHRDTTSRTAERRRCRPRYEIPKRPQDRGRLGALEAAPDHPPSLTPQSRPSGAGAPPRAHPFRRAPRACRRAHGGRPRGRRRRSRPRGAGRAG